MKFYPLDYMTKKEFNNIKWQNVHYKVVLVVIIIRQNSNKIERKLFLQEKNYEKKQYTTLHSNLNPQLH
jgi:hypothetical protein